VQRSWSRSVLRYSGKEKSGLQVLSLTCTLTDTRSFVCTPCDTLTLVYTHTHTQRHTRPHACTIELPTLLPTPPGPQCGDVRWRLGNGALAPPPQQPHSLCQQQGPRTYAAPTLSTLLVILLSGCSNFLLFFFFWQCWGLNSGP
jgi:hypothetical protein